MAVVRSSNSFLGLFQPLPLSNNDVWYAILQELTTLVGFLSASDLSVGVGEWVGSLKCFSCQLQTGSNAVPLPPHESAEALHLVPPLALHLVPPLTIFRFPTATGDPFLDSSDRGGGMRGGQVRGGMAGGRSGRGLDMDGGMSGLEQGNITSSLLVVSMNERWDPDG